MAPATVFQVLSNPLRLALIECLCIGEQSSGDLAIQMHDRFSVGWPAVSRHLGVLRNAAIVRVIPDFTTRWYVLGDDWLGIVQSAVDSLHHEWQRQQPLRELGFAAEVESAHVEAAPQPWRRQRGRSRRTRALRGFDRSHWVEDTDGGAGLT